MNAIALTYGSNAQGAVCLPFISQANNIIHLTLQLRLFINNQLLFIMSITTTVFARTFLNQ